MLVCVFFCLSCGTGRQGTHFNPRLNESTVDEWKWRDKWMRKRTLVVVVYCLWLWCLCLCECEEEGRERITMLCWRHKEKKLIVVHKLSQEKGRKDGRKDGWMERKRTRAPYWTWRHEEVGWGDERENRSNEKKKKHGWWSDNRLVHGGALRSAGI